MCGFRRVNFGRNGCDVITLASTSIALFAVHGDVDHSFLRPWLVHWFQGAKVTCVAQNLYDDEFPSRVRNCRDSCACAGWKPDVLPYLAAADLLPATATGGLQYAQS